MSSRNKNRSVKVAVVFVNNEIILGALKKIIEKMGYTVRQDMDSCLDAKFAVIGAYFAYLGIVKQLRATNLLMPIVVIENSEYSLNGLSGSKELYDVIRIDSNDESEICHKIGDWFSKGNGKFLIEENEHAR